MFVGFNLNSNKDCSFYYERGKKMFNSNRDRIKKELDDFLLNDGSIDGTKMQEVWFPQINADIFISHSHKDEKKAIELAGWLNYRFDLKVFIDSCVWGYADELLKKIDNEFCRSKDGETYIYEKRNYSTSHVHMMLSTALSMMIDRTECLIFMNTPNSVTVSDIITKTESPWIYSEIAMTKLIRNKKLEEYRPKQLEKKSYNEAFAQQIVVKYDISLEHLEELNNHDLEFWNKNSTNKEYPLDDLYIYKALL